MKETENTITPQIQPLVDGELTFDARAKLLRIIDTEQPSAWRDVALAFVEREILAEAVKLKMRSSRPVTAFWVAAAACLALGCFALGRGMRSDADSPPRIAQPASAIAAAEPEYYPKPSPALLRSTNERLASTGYEASMLTRYVRADLEDGNQIVIPVSQLLLGYRGD